MVWGGGKGGFRLSVHGLCLEHTFPQQLLLFLILGLQPFSGTPRDSESLPPALSFSGFSPWPDPRDMATQGPRLRPLPKVLLWGAGQALADGHQKDVFWVPSSLFLEGAAYQAPDLCPIGHVATLHAVFEEVIFRVAF